MGFNACLNVQTNTFSCYGIKIKNTSFIPNETTMAIFTLSSGMKELKSRYVLAFYIHKYDQKTGEWVSLVYTTRKVEKLLNSVRMDHVMGHSHIIETV